MENEAVCVENEAVCVALQLASTAWFKCAARASPVPCVVFGDVLAIIYSKFCVPRMPIEH